MCSYFFSLYAVASRTQACIARAWLRRNDQFICIQRARLVSSFLSDWPHPTHNAGNQSAHRCTSRAWQVWYPGNQSDPKSLIHTSTIDILRRRWMYWILSTPSHASLLKHTKILLEKFHKNVQINGAVVNVTIIIWGWPSTITLCMDKWKDKVGMQLGLLRCSCVFLDMHQIHTDIWIIFVQHQLLTNISYKSDRNFWYSTCCYHIASAVASYALVSIELILWTLQLRENRALVPGQKPRYHILGTNGKPVRNMHPPTRMIFM